MSSASTTPEAIIITGGPGTGKTQRLIDRASALIASGENPSDILILCATPQAACELKRRLDKTTAIDSGAIEVATARCVALSVLSDKAAISFTGRNPRLLASFEELFLMEDVKVSGMRTNRLREMLKFFFRSWTELADDDPNWLVSNEEMEIHDLLKANLSLMNAMIEPEVSSFAVKYLRANDEAKTKHGRMHVLVDDLQNISRASQLLAGLIATKTLTVAGDANACVQVYESYPFASGLDEFVQMHPYAKKEALTVAHRSQASTIADRHLLAGGSMSAAELEIDPTKPVSKPTILPSASPNEEFLSIAHTISASIEAGVPASRIVVASPNDVWSRNIVKALRAQGLRVEMLAGAQPLRGDIRDNDRCVPARIMTALILVANPHDAAAWRCWCGFGDYLANSTAFAKIRDIAEKRGTGLEETLKSISEGIVAAGGVDIANVITAYRSGLDLIEKTQELIGSELLNAVAKTITNGAERVAPASIESLCLQENDQEDALSMMQNALRRLNAPTLFEEDAVAVVPYDLTCGLSPDVLVVAGFVNGFIPDRDYFDSSVTPPNKQEQMHSRDTRRMYSLLGKAETTLIASYFTSIDLESGSKLRLKLDRIRLDHGIRTCTISPSDFIAQLEQA